MTPSPLSQQDSHAKRDAESQAPRGRPARGANWKRWGPYLSERQWGTVREDYSADGSAWNYFPHDHARSRAYRWGEDGLLGICDRECRLCFALALWNGRDPILKERLFGLTGPEGNHGEDVKECYFYLDSTPTHSYMKALYKYPQAEFPYARLVEENRRRGRTEPEFELLDTGVFDENRYFDVFVGIRQGLAGRHPDPDHRGQSRARSGAAAPAADALVSQHLVVGLHARRLLAEAAASGRPRTERSLADHATPGPLPPRGQSRSPTAQRRSCSSRTTRRTHARLFGGAERATVRQGRLPRVRRQRPARTRSIRKRPGTKAAAHYRLQIPAGGRGDAAAPPVAEEEAPAAAVRPGVRRRSSPIACARPTSSIEPASLPTLHAEPRRARRPARPTPGCCGRKQFYHYVVKDWLEGDPEQPPPPGRRAQRPQPRLAAPVQPRRDLDAGQVGISLVRRLGPGLSHDPVRPDRPDVRQGAADAASARVVHAPQRPAAGLRVGLLRRESAGPCLGLLARLQDDGAARPARPALPGPRLSEAAASISPGG